jgi:hypothetical protein
MLDYGLVMTLYKELSPKQKRSIKRDIALIISLKGLTFPKTIDEIKEIGFFSPKIKANKREIYFSKDGRVALRRICDFIHQTKKYCNLLSYNDVFQSIISEIGRWIDDELVPDDSEFIDPLDTLLLKKIDDFTFFCRVDGIALKNTNSIKIGKYKVKEYDQMLISGIIDTTDLTNNVIKKEYSDALVIIGNERGSASVAKMKFYHNADLSLSVLRLYSCALYPMAIHKLNIRLINNCTQAYGPASSFGWRDSERSLMFTRYFRSEQDLKIDIELLNHIRSKCFYEILYSLIGKEQNNELENAILKALFWIGEAQQDRLHASAWIKLWTSMECFFALKDTKITEQNARGISSIFAFGGYSHEGYGDYSELKKKIKQYYELRSNVVHRAEYTHIDEVLLEDFSFIASWTVITMASLLSQGYTTLTQVQEQAVRLDGLARKSNEKG